MAARRPPAAVLKNDSLAGCKVWAWFSEERMQQLGYFSLFIARELRIDDVNAIQASKADESLETIIPAIGISINRLYSSDSFLSIP